MAKTAKVSCRYGLPQERADKYGQTKIYGVATYAKKRVRFSLTLESWEIGLMFLAINSDGTLREDWEHYVSEDLCKETKELSGALMHFREVVLKIVERAVKANVWERMTGADLNALLTFTGFPSSKQEEKKLFGRNGILETWIKKTK